MTTILPRPDVNVTKTNDGDFVVISRDGRGKSYKIEGISTSEQIKGVVEKVINDKYTGEWLP